MGKRAVLSVSEKKECCTYGEQFPVVSQHNTANNFFLFWNTLVSWCCTGDILKEKNNWKKPSDADERRVRGAKHEKL